MKKSAIIAIAGIALASCGKDDIPPVTGFNSQLTMDKTNFYNLQLADSVTGSVDFQFIIKKDSAQGFDTTKFTQSFQVANPMDARTIYFNTPANTITSNFTVHFTIHSTLADSVSINQITYKKDNVTLLNQPLYFITTKSSNFVSYPLTYNF